MFKTNRLLGAISLISGTCIGAGMLALPTSTAAYGFFPSSLLFLLCWIAMTFAGLLILEVTLWLPPDSNLITMAGATLGNFGKIIAWTAYLFLLYCLMSAYLGGMSAILLSTVDSLFHSTFDVWISSATLVVTFGLIIYLGAKPIDYINRILLTVLILCFGILIFIISPHVELPKLAYHNFHQAWLALPIIITAFGFHIVIPSISTYLKDDAKKLRHAILIGATLPLFFYIIWEGLIFGIIPMGGTNGLLNMAEGGQPAVDLTRTLHALLRNPWIDEIATLFAFFLIATSFIGVSFSLFDFLADGLHILKNKLGRIIIAAITFIPPLLFTHFYPKGFIVALGYAGIFVAILLCILPACMVWSGRHWRKIAKGYRAPGGRIALAALVVFSIAVIMAEIL